MAELTQIDIARAATNDAALSDITFKLGDREFPIVDLPYDEYVKFLALMQPFFEGFIGKMAGFKSSDLDAITLLKSCSKILPDLACIVCSQTDPTVTPDELKKLAKSPIQLASLVVAQIQRNGMIQEIVDFFKQTLPLLKTFKRESK